MIAACDINGFVVQSCEIIRTTGSGPDVGTIDRERFEMWIENKLCPVLGNYGLGQPRSLVVMDNATIHHSEIIKQLIEQKGAKLVYLPPYSPDLNPIELMFGQYKLALKRFGHEHNWVVSHVRGLQDAVTPENARSFFRHSGIPIHEQIDTEFVTKITIIAVVLTNISNYQSI